MKLRTVCPHCASVFRLAADQVEAAQGWVQCGVCGTAFDARPTLTLEDGSPLPEPAPPEAEASPAETEAAAVETAEAREQAPGAAETDIAEVAAPTAAARADEAPGAQLTPGAEEAGVAAEPPPGPVPAGVARRESAAELPSIILIDPDAAALTDLGPLPEIPAAPARPTAAPAPKPPAAQIEYATASAGTRPTARGRKTAKPRTPAWVWASLAALLTLVLLAQAAWLLRDTAIGQAPVLRPLYGPLCARFGCSVGLPKNVAQLQIIGSDLQKEANDRLTLTLTLGNRAAHAQAWPMLVLTLTDARGQPLSRRSFAPSEYLDDPRRIAAGLPPRSEQALSLPLTVSGIQPMGFDLKLAY